MSFKRTKIQSFYFYKFQNEFLWPLHYNGFGNIYRITKLKYHIRATKYIISIAIETVSDRIVRTSRKCVAVFS